MSDDLTGLRAALRECLARQVEDMRCQADEAAARHLVLAEALARLDAGSDIVLRALALEWRRPLAPMWDAERSTAMAVRYGITATEDEASTWVAERFRSSRR
jgi:hypothetical protein